MDAIEITFEIPAFAPTDGEAIARDRFGVAATATPLPGERDRNFLLCTGAGERYVLKISHAGEARALLELQNEVLDHLAAQAPDLRLSRVVRSLAGEGIVERAGPTGTRHFVRLLTWVDGRMMADVSPHDITLLESLGETLGAVDRSIIYNDANDHNVVVEATGP